MMGVLAELERSQIKEHTQAGSVEFLGESDESCFLARPVRTSHSKVEDNDFCFALTDTMLKVVTCHCSFGA